VIDETQMRKVGSRLSVNQAIDKVQRSFPFDGYMEENLSPYRTVGEVMHRDGDNHERITRFADACNIDFTETFQPAGDEGFDIVMMNDVLEHIHDSPRDLMNDLVSMLAPEGLLFLTVPNLANLRKRLDLLRGRTNLPRFDLFYWYQGPWRGPIREYVRPDLEKLVEHLGLEMVQLSTAHHMLKNLPAKLEIPYKIITRIAPDLADTWLLLAKRPASWNPRRELSKSEFAKIYGTVNKQGLY